MAVELGHGVGHDRTRVAAGIAVDHIRRDADGLDLACPGRRFRQRHHLLNGFGEGPASFLALGHGRWLKELHLLDLHEFAEHDAAGVALTVRDFPGVPFCAVHLLDPGRGNHPVAKGPAYTEVIRGPV